MATKTTNNSLGVTDLPLDTPDDDLLGIVPYADGLYRFITNCESPMTIGVQGEWGSGKSSLMKLVCKKLESHQGKILVHWFDTWQYGAIGDDSALGLQLLSDLTQSVADRHSQDMNIMMKSARLMNFTSRAMQVAQSGAKLIGKAALAGATNMATGGVIDGGTLVNGFFNDDSSKKQFKLSDARDGFLSIVNAHIESTKIEGSRVVVFIDDLDRIHPSKAVLFLEMLKNFIEVRGCVFVVACDFDVIREGVRDRLGIDDSAKVQAFFDKIFQVPFVLPTSNYRSNATLREFIHKSLGNHAEKLSIAARNTISSQVSNSIVECIDISTGTNPRALKRYFNLVDLLVCVQRSQPNATIHDWSNPIYVAVLLATIAFHKRWPVVVSYIANISSSGDFNRTIQAIIDPEESDQADEQIDDVITSSVIIKDANGDWRDSSEGDALIQFIAAYVQVLDQDSNGSISSSEFELLRKALSVLHLNTSQSSKDGYESSIYRFVDNVRKSGVISSSQEADFILYVMNSIVQRLRRNKYCKLTRSQDRFNPQIQMLDRRSFAPITFSLSQDPSSQQAVQIQLHLGANQAKRQDTPELVLIGQDFIEKTTLLGLKWEPTGQKYRARFNLGPKASLQSMQAKFVDHIIHLIDQCVKAVSQKDNEIAHQAFSQEN